LRVETYEIHALASRKAHEPASAGFLAVSPTLQRGVGSHNNPPPEPALAGFSPQL